MLHNKKLSQGRSMVEMLGVLGIMALITALGIIAYNQATHMFKIDRLKNDIAFIVQELNKISFIKGKSSIVDFGEDQGEAAFKKHFIDTGYFKSNQTPLGNKSSYRIGTNENSNSMNFVIRIDNIQDEGLCEALYNQDFKEKLKLQNCKNKDNRFFQLYFSK